MMMKKKFVAVALSAVCLLSAVGCGQQSASTASSASSVSSSVASSASASQVMDAEGLSVWYQRDLCGTVPGDGKE